MNGRVLVNPAARLALIVALALSASPRASAQVRITEAPGQITVDVNGRPFTVFHTGGTNLNRPYLHPLRSASGRVVTRSLPAGQLPGETTDHPHHAGLFYGHGDVNGYNYWAIQNVATPPSQAGSAGRIVVQSVGPVKSGRDSGAVTVVLDWLTPTGAPLLKETRTMTFHAHPELRIIDFDFDLMAVQRVVFRDTKEGTFALRMATALDEQPRGEKGGATPTTGKLTNAQGREGEVNVWGKRSEWVDYSGRIEGEAVGVVMMDHPGNPRHPTYWHSRAYGLHAINPFGVHDFLNDKTQDGSLTIEPGAHVRFRYRVVVHPGASRTALAEMYAQYVRSKASSPPD